MGGEVFPWEAQLWQYSLGAARFKAEFRPFVSLTQISGSLLCSTSVSLKLMPGALNEPPQTVG